MLGAETSLAAMPAALAGSTIKAAIHAVVREATAAMAVSAAVSQLIEAEARGS